MSGILEMKMCRTVRWKVKVPNRGSHLKSPKFHFGNDEYCLTCYSSDQEISLKYEYTSIETCPSRPSVINVCLETHIPGKFVPSLSSTSLNPTTTDYFWTVRLSDIKKRYPDFNYRKLTFIVTFQKENLSSVSTGDKSVQTSVCIDPIPCTDSLSEDFEKLLGSDSNPDVEFKCDGQSVNAHRLVVSARSPVLARMLQSKMVEGETGFVKIKDMDLDTLKVFVRYLYRGRLDEAPTFELAMVLYETADKYDVKSLVKRCSQSLIESLTVENALQVLDLAEKHNDEKFVEEVIEFVLEKKVPLTSVHWRAFCSSRPQMALDIYSRFSEMYLGDADPDTPNSKKAKFF